MLLLNFAHPFTPAQLEQLAKLSGAAVERVLDLRTQFDHTRPFVEQAHALVEQAGLTPAQWQTTPLLVNPPALNVVACLVLAEMHGRMGYFPTVVRLRPVPGTTPPAFEVAELLNLHHVREQARAQR
jgi:hypothetical protein